MAHAREVSLEVSDRSKDCNATCTGKCGDCCSPLKGVLTRNSTNGRFKFCDLTYCRSECIQIKAVSAEDLSPDQTDSTDICISPGVPKRVACSSDVERAIQFREFGSYTGTLFDGEECCNAIHDAQRDNPAFTCTLQEKPSCATCVGDNTSYVKGGNLAPAGVLYAEKPCDGRDEKCSALKVVPVTDDDGAAKVQWDDLTYTRGRPEADPLRMEISCTGGIVSSGDDDCRPVEVVGLRLVCTETAGVPSLSSSGATSGVVATVTAGQSFKILGEMMRVDGEGKYEIIDCTPGDANAKCGNTRGFVDICDSGCGGATATENQRFKNSIAARGSKAEVTAGDASTAVDCGEHTTQAACDGAPSGLCQWTSVLAAPHHDPGMLEECMPKTPRGRLDIDGHLSWRGLVYYVATPPGAEFVPSITPKSPLIAAEHSQHLSHWLRSSTAMGSAPGTCNPVRVIADIPYELCLGDEGCDKCGGGECGSCPVELGDSIVAGDKLDFLARVHDQFGNLVGPPRSDLVAVSCKVTQAPKQTVRQREAQDEDCAADKGGCEPRLYPFAVLRNDLAEADDTTTGVSDLPEEGVDTFLKVAGNYEVTCWADAKVRRVDHRSDEGTPL
jgi:hypothetical protein